MKSQRESSPGFPWAPLIAFSIIGLGGCAFNIAGAVSAAKDRHTSSGVETIFTLLALVFLIGWIWIVSLLVKGHRDRSEDGFHSDWSADKQEDAFIPASPSKPLSTAPIYDLKSWKPMFKESETMATDLHGKFYLRLDDNTVMDMDTGETRWITPWSADDKRN